MTAKSRIAAIRLAERIEKNKPYAEKIGVSVEMKRKAEKEAEKEAVRVEK